MGSSIKTWVIVLICCGLVQVAASQSLPPEPPARVERSSFGVQVGLVSLFVNHELRLADQVALRTELGMHGTLFYTSHLGFDRGLTFSATIEPRGYYNLAKRKEQGRDIAGNSGNFFALRMHYARAIILTGLVNRLNLISIVPMWGIRRNLGRHFNYEVATGIGWMDMFQSLNDIGVPSLGGPTYDLLRHFSAYLHLRIGYRF